MIYDWQPEVTNASMLSGIDWAVIIAALALITTIVFNTVDHWRQRRHARLSIRPRITFDRGEMPDRVSITMVNRGLGPARMMRFVFFVDGVAGPMDINSPNQLIEVLVAECGVTNVSPVFKLMGFETIAEPGKELDLIVLTPKPGLGPDAQTAAIESARDGLRKVGILVVYKSLFDEQFVACTFSGPALRHCAIGGKSDEQLMREFPGQPHVLVPDD